MALLLNFTLQGLYLHYFERTSAFVLFWVHQEAFPAYLHFHKVENENGEDHDSYLLVKIVVDNIVAENGPNLKEYVESDC